MSNTILFVRIGPKTGPEKFFRCAIQFARTWTRVEVDAATAERLRGEQMLEVTSTQPADYVPTDADAEAAPTLGDLVKAALTEKAQAIADADAPAGAGAAGTSESADAPADAGAAGASESADAPAGAGAASASEPADAQPGANAADTQAADKAAVTPAVKSATKKR